MVYVCSLTNYTNETKYKQYFEKYSYGLHIFQKWAIEAIVTGNHVLVCAPTGSGKTLPGEFALDYFFSLGKKVIYTSPIKALSNQKFYDFTQKYPHIRVGLITGDIKTNPDADVLIMTTEILLNKLYQIKSKSQLNSVSSSISFEMDIETELGCVVFDEIHMINDASRGHVWEQSIMMLPSHIQMIGLSATLDNPERFAYWLETRGDPEQYNKNIHDINSQNSKIVYLTTKKVRSVPLTHYAFITTNESIFKYVKDKAVQEEIKQMINKPFVIQNASGQFIEESYFKMTKLMKLFEFNNVRIKRQHALNQVTKHLVEHEMLPALCYVFSRKQLEICAKEVTTNLLEFDSKVPYIIDKECEHIIRKLPNYQEYMQLPEYVNMVQLLRKGIGMHHAGLLPVLREIVELLFAKGYIKLLFCTETIAIGLNLPVKTSIFTDVQKFDGDNLRALYSHEYTQAAGRAGRLGLDTVGNVIHLNNLFRNVDSVTYKTMMNGKPPCLTSKFKISYNLLLSLIDIGDNHFVEFARKSMVKEDIDSQLKEIYYEITKATTALDNSSQIIQYLRTPIQVVNQYIDLLKRKNVTVNKKRKETEKEILRILNEYKYVEQDKNSVEKYNEKQYAIEQLQESFKRTEKYIDSNVTVMLTFLETKGFIHNIHNNDNISIPTTNNTSTNPEFKLTIKGSIASHLKEVHCLVFASLFEDNMIDSFTPTQLVSLFSCFTNVSIQEDYKELLPKCESIELKKVINSIHHLYKDYQNDEMKLDMNTGVDYNIHFDLINYVDKWCACENGEECKLLLQLLEREKGVFLGEFVKALLKINNVSCELEKIAELYGNIGLLSKLREIPSLTLKYVVTNQSLYV